MNVDRRLLPPPEGDTPHLLELVSCVNPPQSSFRDDDDDSDGSGRTAARSGGKFEVNQENLETVLSTVGDLPLYTISIVGPHKQGKTLLTGYLIRYLAATEKNLGDWIDWKNSDKGMTEVEWPTGSSPSQPGIWCYSRVFTLQIGGGAEGKKVAVLLLYSQIGRNWSDEQAVANLVGLTLSMSSYTVINVTKQIDEKLLSSLGTAMLQSLQLSKVDQDNRSPEDHFQKLAFLVRDWNFPTEYPFGAKGGSEHLKQKLEPNKAGKLKNAKTCRDMLANYFQDNVYCFLLPYPGGKVSTPEFTGSVDHLDDNFAKKLEDFITVWDEVTTWSGEMSNSGKWRNQLEVLVNNTNTEGGGARQKKSLAKQLAGLSLRDENEEELSPKEQKKIIRKCVNKYSDTWKKQSKNKPYLSNQEIEKANKASKKRALELLRKLLTPADDEDENEDEEEEDDDRNAEMKRRMEKQLKKDLDKQFQEMKRTNSENKKESLDEAMEECLQEFVDSLTSTFPAGKQAVQNRVEKLSQEILSGSLDNFQENFELNDDEKDDDEDDACNPMEKLKQMLMKAQREFIAKRFKATKPETLEKAGSVSSSQKRPTSKVGSISSISIKSAFSEEDMSSPKLSRKHLGILSGPEQPSKPPLSESETESEASRFPSSSRLKFEESTEETSTRRNRRYPRRDNQVAEQELIRQGDQLITLLEGEYTSLLERNHENVNDSNHLRNTRQFVEQFQGETPFSLGSPHNELYEVKLKDKLDQVFSEAKIEKAKNQRKWKAKIAEMGQDMSRAYEACLKKLITEGDITQVEELQERHEGLVEKNLKKLSQEITKLGVSVDAVILKEGEKNLKGQLDTVHSEMKRSLKAKQTKALSDSKNAENECFEKYLKGMNQASDASRHQHQKLMKEGLEMFKKLAPDNPEMKERLEQRMEESFLKGQKKSELLERSRKNEVTLALQQARQFYDQEMDKHFKNQVFIEEKELRSMHAEVCQKAIAKCGKVSRPELEDLKDFLQTAFSKYEDQNQMNRATDPAIGIDLGTTYSCLAVYGKGEIRIIPNSIGKKTTPSYVAFHPDGTETVGEQAKIRAYEDPENTIFDAKRLIGRKYNDPKVQDDMKLWPFNVENDDGVPKIKVNGKKLHPEEVSGRLLQQLRQDAEDFLKCKVTKAVITVPAYFNDGQRQATIDAGKCAGLEVLSILTEPVAAAIAYKLQHSYGSAGQEDVRHVLIYDLGGGTFDVAILKISKGEVEVLVNDGDTHLGGEDFDKNTMKFCAEEFKQQQNIDLFDGQYSTIKNTRDDVRRRLKRLQGECERRKMELTRSPRAEVALDRMHGSLDLKVTVSRKKFEEFNDEFFQQTIAVVERALISAKVDKKKIDDVVLVGGSTRIPKIQKMLSDYFNGKKLNSSINPDEAVAYGAAVKAAILSGSISKTSGQFMQIKDVTPMSIGVEVYGGGFSVIIPKSTRVPVKCQEKYMTAHNNQTSVQITIFQGENPIAVNNEHLGDFYLNGIRPNVAGAEDIEVEMVINDQGILHVSARTRGSGVSSKVMVIESKKRMAQATIKALAEVRNIISCNKYC